MHRSSCGPPTLLIKLALTLVRSSEACVYLGLAFRRLGGALLAMGRLGSLDRAAVSTTKTTLLTLPLSNLW